MILSELEHFRVGLARGYYNENELNYPYDMVRRGSTCLVDI